MTDAPRAEPDTNEHLQEGDDASAPHDALFYRTLSVPEHAAAVLKDIFGAELASRFEWDTLALKSLKLVDAKLTRRYADVLFTVRMRGRETLIHILWEHKSQPEWWTLLQVLEYKPRIWRACLEESGNQDKKHLPVILTVVLHHGERGWYCPVRFRDYFDIAPEDVELLAPYLLDFGIALEDISKASGEALARKPVTPAAQLVLFALRFGRTPNEFFQQLPKLVGAMMMLRQQPNGDLVIAGVIMYVKTVGKVSEQEVRVALQQSLGLSVAEEILYGPERRIEQARRDGERAGELRGQRTVLKRLLGRKFGALPADTLARIDAASAAELEAMELRVLSASTLDEVLGDCMPTVS